LLDNLEADEYLPMLAIEHVDDTPVTTYIKEMVSGIPEKALKDLESLYDKYSLLFKDIDFELSKR
jgi:hypothetical protein